MLSLIRQPPRLPVFGGMLDMVGSYSNMEKEHFLAYTALDLTNTSFETVGKTGSGATNIWTALDYVPAWANLLYLSVQLLGYDATTGGNRDVYLSIRQNAQDELVTVSVVQRAGDGNAVASELYTGMIPGPLPIQYKPDDWGLFEFKIAGNFTTMSASIKLMGVGVNGRV
jgi:hypothetical protein